MFRDSSEQANQNAGFAVNQTPLRGKDSQLIHFSEE